MNNPERPWWAPDAQGFLAGGIVLICGIALFVRMASTSTVDDKMLDTMITILFSTCLVTVYNYSFGSSRGSAAKDETQAKVAEKLAETASKVATMPLADQPETVVTTVPTEPSVTPTTTTVTTQEPKP